MKSIGQLFVVFLASLFLIGCDGQKMDDPQLIETLQTQIEDIINQGYQIDKINIYSKSFSDYGPAEIGYFKLLFVDAVSPDSSIQYLANFSYSGDTKRLTFHGYPDTPMNRKKNKTYISQPDLRNALSKLEEMKKLIPEKYRYENLLSIRYFTDDNHAEYKFEIELEPESDDLSHPKVKKKKDSYVKYTTTRSRKKFGTTQEKHKTDIKRKNQHTITFQLIGDQITIQ
ncbi:MAG: hypothetical protein LUH22_11475 [Bacteroides sp.]|nr:hypothetical protein [Bacteroides sp.]